MFETVETPSPDAIYAVMAAVRADPRPGKIDLSIGVYHDRARRTPIMRAVREAERRLIETEQSKSYLELAGHDLFKAGMTTLAFGDAAHDRLRAAQTPGGTGAVRVLAELIRRARPDASIWLSSPTWPNHPAIMRAAGLEIHNYPYFDAATNEVRSDAMLDALGRAGPGDVVLLHGCCHNPTGAELAAEHWEAIAELALKRGFLPFVDFAYQGFGDGVEEDAFGLRLLAAKVPEMVVAASCSKNFGLYRDRVGCAFVLGASPERADVMLGQLLSVARANYSSPPAHGAAIVGSILADPALRAEWRAELDDMRAHMLGLRRMLAASLRTRTNGDRFDFLARHRGMFSLLGASPEQVARLRDEHAVYLVGAGRINIAGLPEAEVDRFADALVAVLGR
ncbi:MAG TPA: amino acid aminotransferase [Geminicoccaceae bacterium]|nr:amino acid aminotransferase [Geminicoccaceae bacterium]